MDQRSNSRLSLFLMELIVAIMFFSLSAAVCVRLFASAHLLSDSTECMTNATIWAQNLAEAFEDTKGNLNDIAKLFPYGYVTYDTNDASMKDGAILLYFDDKWNALDSLAGASFVAYLNTVTEDADTVYSDITDYGTALIGKARVGHIGILDIRNVENFEFAAPDDYKNILKVDVDTYLGKEED